MARPRGRHDARRVAYQYLTVAEDGIEPGLRAELAALLAATLDDGEAYRERAWRTLRPAFRVIALAPAGSAVGQASGFWVPCRPPTRLLGLGDVAVAPEHRRRGGDLFGCGCSVEGRADEQVFAPRARLRAPQPVVCG
jgi:hypothetical protein